MDHIKQEAIKVEDIKVEDNTIQYINVEDIKVKDYNNTYIHYSNIPHVLVNIYSTVYKEYGNTNSEKIEYTIYIDAPYFIYIVIDKYGKYDLYRSTHPTCETKEGYFDINLNKKIYKNFYCKIIDLYNLFINNLLNYNKTNGFEIIDLIVNNSLYNSKLNKFCIISQIAFVMYKMNEIVLNNIPTFEERYGFSNIILDDKPIIDKLNEINENNNFGAYVMSIY